MRQRLALNININDNSTMTLHLPLWTAMAMVRMLPHQLVHSGRHPREDHSTQTGRAKAKEGMIRLKTLGRGTFFVHEKALTLQGRIQLATPT